MMDAIRRRHAYAATDNIILDFRAASGGREYIMGDVVPSKQAPKLSIRAIGTDRITQLVIVKNQQFIYTARPNTVDVRLEFVDRDFRPGSNYYYVRVLQNDGQLAWSKAAGFASRRRDVPTDHVPELLVPKEGVTYQVNHGEQYVRMRGEILEFLRTLMPS